MSKQYYLHKYKDPTLNTIRFCDPLIVFEFDDKEVAIDPELKKIYDCDLCKYRNDRELYESLVDLIYDRVYEELLNINWNDIKKHGLDKQTSFHRVIYTLMVPFNTNNDCCVKMTFNRFTRRLVKVEGRIRYYRFPIPKELINFTI